MNSELTTPTTPPKPVVPAEFAEFVGIRPTTDSPSGLFALNATTASAAPTPHITFADLHTRMEELRHIADTIPLSVRLNHHLLSMLEERTAPSKPTSYLRPIEVVLCPWLDNVHVVLEYREYFETWNLQTGVKVRYPKYKVQPVRIPDPIIGSFTSKFLDQDPIRYEPIPGDKLTEDLSSTTPPINHEPLTNGD